MRLLAVATAMITAAALSVGAAAYTDPPLGGTEVQGIPVDLVFSVKDLVFVVDDTGGKIKDLEVTETKTEIHIDLAADVLFDFDKSTLRAGGPHPTTPSATFS